MEVIWAHRGHACQHLGTSFVVTSGEMLPACSGQRPGPTTERPAADGQPQAPAGLRRRKPRLQAKELGELTQLSSRI